MDISTFKSLSLPKKLSLVFQRDILPENMREEDMKAVPSMTEISKRNRERIQDDASDELAEDINDDSATDSNASAGHTFSGPRHEVEVLGQPHCLSGGLLKSYQLESLQWLVSINQICTHFRAQFVSLPEDLHSLIPMGSTHKRTTQYAEINAAQIGAILGDEMGLGKTIQTISLLAFSQETLKVSMPHLVIVPKSTLPQWEAEFAKWVPSFQVLTVIGDKTQREEIIRTKLINVEIRPHVCLTTYDVIRLEFKELSRILWYYMILDEGHKLKDNTSQISHALRGFTTLHKVILSGTPLQNNLHELWALLNFISPLIFNIPEDFVGLVRGEVSERPAIEPSPQGEQGGEDSVTIEVNEELSETTETITDASTTQPASVVSNTDESVAAKMHDVLKLFILRREKKDVESLPAKREYLINCGMTSLQRSLYKSLLAKDLGCLDKVLRSKSNTSSIGKTSLINIVMQLRKCADHPYLFNGVEPQPFKEGDHIVNVSGKMVVLDKLITRIKAINEKVLVFCQMTSMLNIIEDYLRYREHLYCRIDGSTDLETRAKYMKMFNMPTSPVFVFLLSTRAGCLGLNLTAANHVIIYQQDFNPQADLQAVARAYRLLQTKEVFVYRLLAENTVDTRIYERAQLKLGLDNLIIQTGNFANNPHIDKLLGDADLKSKAMTRNQLLDMIAVSSENLFTENQKNADDAEEAHNYDTPEIQINDSKLDELLNTALRRRDAVSGQLNQKIKSANEIISKLASDGKLEHINTDELYHFEGMSYTKSNLKKITDFLHRERTEKEEAERLKRIAAISLIADVPEKGSGRVAKDKRQYPTMRKLKLAADVYKADIQLLPLRYYELLGKIANEISSQIEPTMSANKELEYADFARERGYVRPELPGLNQEELTEFYSFLGDGCPYLADGKEISRREFNLLLTALCDYDVELYADMTGVRRVSYDRSEKLLHGGLKGPGAPTGTENSAQKALRMAVTAVAAQTRGLSASPGVRIPLILDGAEGKLVHISRAENLLPDVIEQVGSDGKIRRIRQTLAPGLSENDRIRVIAEIPDDCPIVIDSEYCIEISGRENLDIVFLAFAEKMRTGRESALRFSKAEVVNYCNALLQNIGCLEEADRIKARIDRTRKKRRAYFKRVLLLRRWIDSYTNPLYQLPVPIVVNQRRFYSDLEDRFILIMLDLFGYGCWHEIVMQIRLSPLFAFDWWFKTRTEDEIAHRAERLVRYLEQDFKQASDDEDEYSDLPSVQQKKRGPRPKEGSDYDPDDAKPVVTRKRKQ